MQPLAHCLPNYFRLRSVCRPSLEDQPMSRLQLEPRPMSRLFLEGRPMSRLLFEDWPMNGLHLSDQPMRSLLAERRGHLDWDRSGRGNGHGTITTISLSTLHIGESNYFFVHGQKMLDQFVRGRKCNDTDVHFKMLCFYYCMCRYCVRNLCILIKTNSLG